MVLNIRTAGEQSTFYQTPLDRQKEGILNEFEIFPSIFPPLYSDENTSRGDREILPSASAVYIHRVVDRQYTVYNDRPAAARLT